MMQTKTRQIDKQRGSALIMVVVVTVLLAVVGVMFVMVARVGEMETSAVIDTRDLNTAVESVVTRIRTVLVEDLFSDGKTIGSNGPLFNRPGKNPWLASLEPDIGVDGFGVPVYFWRRVTDLYDNNFGVPALPVYYDPQHDDLNDPTERDGSNPELIADADGVLVKIIKPGDRTYVIMQNAADWSKEVAGARADASGDGVADSRWVKVPNLTASRGQPVFVAVRIIDNCAMLNLNTAFCFYQAPNDPIGAKSRFERFWRSSETADPYMGTIFSSNAPYGEGGRYLTEINYLPFLRGSDLFSGGDVWYNLSKAKKFSWLDSSSQLRLITPEQAHNAIMNIENPTLHPILPAAYFTFFDIGDELEMRNRFLMTTKVEARFERKDVGNFSYDAGGSDYAALTVPREDKMEDGIPHIARWKWRVDPKNFDSWSGGDTGLTYRYDRRHISTFYSFDRPLRTGRYPSLPAALAAEPVSLRRDRESVFRPLDNRPIDLRTLTDPTNPDRITANTTNARKNSLHLLYAFRAFYMEGGDTQAAAAKKSAQIVANLIDYLDTDASPTVINRAYVRQRIIDVSGALPVPNNIAIDIGATVPATPSPYEFGLGVTDATETVYGFERQPFISEIYCNRNPAMGGNVDVFGLELVNPYPAAISLQGWRISIGTTNNYDLDATYSVPAATGGLPNQFGRLTIHAGSPPISGGQSVLRAGFGLGTQLNNAIITLHRPHPVNTGQYVSVDQTRLAQSTAIFSANGVRVSKRDDKEWRFASNFAYVSVDNVGTLGQANTVDATRNSFQLPVADTLAPFYTFGDFTKVAMVSNQAGGTAPKTITEIVADAAGDESKIRLDVRATPELLDYACFLNRYRNPSNLDDRTKDGTLPGRININTAPLHVIAAAIPPQLVMATTTDTNHALALAQQIINNRPYERVSDMLNIAAFRKFQTDASVNVGDQAMLGDFEERDWIVSRLSNIFTVRSDTFTAWILVRLGEDGPQRRMIAIFDRSQCWTPSDRPKLVALHPVKDPR